MKVTQVRRSWLIAVIGVAFLMPGCSSSPSPSELAHAKQVAAQLQTHKDAIKQEAAKKLKDQAEKRAAAAHAKRLKARAAAHANRLRKARAAARTKANALAEAVAEQARQNKARAEREAADAAAAANVRKAPQYGYQCRPGDEKNYSVCAGHKAWVDGQVVFDRCIKSGRMWDVANQKCGGMDPDAGPEG